MKFKSKANKTLIYKVYVFINGMDLKKSNCLIRYKTSTLPPHALLHQLDIYHRHTAIHSLAHIDVQRGHLGSYTNLQLSTKLITAFSRTQCV